MSAVDDANSYGSGWPNALRQARRTPEHRLTARRNPASPARSCYAFRACLVVKRNSTQNAQNKPDRRNNAHMRSTLSPSRHNLAATVAGHTITAATIEHARSAVVAGMKGGRSGSPCAATMRISKRATAGARTVTVTRRGQFIRLKVLLFALFILVLGITIKITDERHPEPPESRTDVRAAHSVDRLVMRRCHGGRLGPCAFGGAAIEAPRS